MLRKLVYSYLCKRKAFYDKKIKQIKIMLGWNCLTKYETMMLRRELQYLENMVEEYNKVINDLL